MGMGVAVAIPLFLASLVVTLVAAATFARRLDRLGARFGLSELSIGLLTALAADGPEISSALVALARGAHDASVGVIVGSNTFNLAAMVGVSVLLAGAVQVTRKTLALEGATGLAVTAIVTALLLGWLSAAVAVVALACVIGPYLILVLGAMTAPAGWGWRGLRGSCSTTTTASPTSAATSPPSSRPIASWR